MKTPTTPNILRINPETGELFCRDGRDVKQYLKKWAKKHGIKKSESLSLATRKTFTYLLDCHEVVKRLAS